MEPTLMEELSQQLLAAWISNQVISQLMLQQIAFRLFTTVEAKSCISIAMCRKIWSVILKP